ncbi:MAG: DinB family protein [Planctomycetes bacterium]|nr:DinB family protein [Planctomycetota bacterium]
MWISTLNREMDFGYSAMRMLLDLCDEDKLDWKPSEDNNWWTLGQLIRHTTQACGWCCKGMVDGVWDMDALGYPVDADPDGLLPASQQPSVESLAHARALLDEDDKLAREMIAKAGEERLESEQLEAPWGTKGTLGQLMLDSATHLNAHKTQLFYYLKLLGKPVNTPILYGMADHV